MRIDRHKKKILVVHRCAGRAACRRPTPREARPTYEKANNDIHNQASLQRGAKQLRQLLPRAATTAKYVRYNRMAADIGLTEKQLTENLLWSGESPHSTMTQRPARRQDGEGSGSAWRHPTCR